MICFLDLDGVLVDFVKGAFALHKVSLPYEAIRWDFVDQLGLSGEEFWSPMGREFWAGLPWTDDGRQILSSVERRFGENVVILTCPCETEGSVQGKIDWIKRELPAYSRRFFVGPPKHLAAGPGKVLIDDYDVNVDKFIEYGGSGVLVPRPWNRRFGVSTLSGIQRDLGSLCL